MQEFSPSSASVKFSAASQATVCDMAKPRVRMEDATMLPSQAQMNKI